MITLSLTKCELEIIQSAMEVAFEGMDPALVDYILEDDISSVFDKLSKAKN